MTTIRTIVDVTVSDSRHWCIYYTLPTGGKHLCAFPLKQLAYRVAEYGLDPKDFDKLLSFVLGELIDMPRMQVSDVHQHFLYNTSEQTARQAALSRLSVIEADTVYLDPDNHLAKLKAAYVADWNPDFHNAHKKLVASLRYHRMREMGLLDSSIPSPAPTDVIS